MDEPLETDRLLLAPWRDTDADLLARMSADPRVVRYIADGRPWPREKAADASWTQVEHWQAHGFGWRVAVDKESGERVGFAALEVTPMPDELEIGWWLMPSAWGRGLASEAARAVRDDAFTRVGAPGLIARLQPANVASARVATRIGMRHERNSTGRVGERVAVYRLLASDWSRTR